MPASKELERLGNLFQLASERNRPFLDRCSEVKYLAISDFDSAMNVTFKLARQAFSDVNLNSRAGDDCETCLERVKDRIETGQLDNDFIHALEDFRYQYLEKVLRPAVQEYLRSEELKSREIDRLYNNALRIKELLVVVQFLKKVEPVEF